MWWRWAKIGLATGAVLLVLAGAASFWRIAHVEKSSPVIANPFLPPGEIDRGWPFIRGADFDGHSPETQLADAWPVGGPPVVWRRTLGEGFSSLVAGGDRVYTQYQDASGQFVVCLDAATGLTVWKYRYDWPFELGEKYPGPRATPSLAHGRVYFAGPSGLIGCLNDRGRLVWSVNVTKKFGGQGTGFGYSCSPTVVDDLVILPVGGPAAAMVALNAHDGSLVWRSGDQSSSYTPAYPIAVGGQRQVIGYMENTVVAHDLATGEQLWVHELSQGYDEHAAWPIYHDGHLWIAAPFQVGSELLKLSGGQGASAVSVRQSDLMSNDVASSVRIGDHIYGFDLRETQTKPGRPPRGTFRCIDFHTGDVRWSQGDPQQRRRWPSRDPVPLVGEPPASPGHANFLVADGKLILLNDTGELILARATPERYEELGRATILDGEICWTSPALHRGCVFVRNHQEAACVYVGSPELFDSIGVSTPTKPRQPRILHVPTFAAALGIQPSNTLSVPPLRQLTIWYAFGLVTIGIALLLAWSVGLVVVAVPMPQKIKITIKSKKRATLLAYMMFAGLAGPLVLSRWRGELIFTWPVALFALLLMTVDQLPLTHGDSNPPRGRWRSLLVVLAFAVGCALYFFACRQLGLPAQWIFLTGFAASLPIAAIGKAVARRTPLPWPAEISFVVVGFTAYYWASVALLAWWTNTG